MPDITAIQRKHWNGIKPELIEAARTGKSKWCVDCGSTSMCGGLRCYPCFYNISKGTS